MENLKCFFFVSFLILASYSLSAKTIRYVKVDGTGDGSSWTNASNNIQTMIDNSASGDEVWVAKGTYYPTTETIARDARSRTFLVKSGVNIRGGFAGNETAISQRALSDLNLDGKKDSCELVNTTLLSGDIDGVPDVWTKTTNTDGTWKWIVTGNSGNCYRVVTGSVTNVIDGFSVSGGNANVTSISDGGGIHSYSSVTNCTVSNCSTVGSGGGIDSYNVTNCTVSNCYAGANGGGIDSYNVTNCTVSNCYAGGNGGGIYSSSVTNCTVSNCFAASSGGGIYSSSSVANCTVSNCSTGGSGGGIYSSSVTNCTVSNCFAASSGGGIYSSSSVANCTVSNCSTGGSGGGIYSSSSSVTNCTVSNCFAASSGGGIYSNVTNCASSNNKTAGVIGSGVVSNSSGYISPDITIAYIRPTTFIGIATTDAQKAELLTADWHLKEGSPCINAGTSTNVSSTILTGTDLDNNKRVSSGTIDIGAYEYVLPIITIPTKEYFSTITGWNSSELFYNSSQINGGQNIKWTIVNQKADFSWQTNLTSTYSQPIFTYQVDATTSAKVFLRYDMYFQAYAGTISPLGTEKLNVEYSTDLVTWSTIATYSNANGTITNQTYKYDLSTQLAGKKFFIRFNANGANSNRIEKWEIDNVIIDADGLSAVNNVQQDTYKYFVNNGVLNINNLGLDATIHLFDINGKLLANKKGTQTVNFTLPCHGVYIVRVASVSGIENKKIVW